ncbi:hypothetical protein L579_0297 [Pantoea sp. AS-PWVM4]|nr:hypothetical protein L579_0297 [Pantoea sp. AS-PWVM4]
MKRRFNLMPIVMTDQTLMLKKVRYRTFPPCKVEKAGSVWFFG